MIPGQFASRSGELLILYRKRPALPGAVQKPAGSSQRGKKSGAIRSVEVESKVKLFPPQSTHHLPLLAQGSFFRVHFQLPGPLNTSNRSKHTCAKRGRQDV